MHTVKQTISLKSPRHWQEMGFPRWHRHTLGRPREWGKRYRNRPLCPVVMPSSQTVDGPSLHVWSLVRKGDSFSKLVQPFWLILWIDSLPQESKKFFFNILFKTTTFLSIVLMIWVSKEPSLSDILIHTPVSTRADQNGSDWRRDWVLLSIGKNAVLFLGWKKGFKYSAAWCKELTGWKRPWLWRGLRAGGEGGDRGWDGWMASPTQWTCVWANSRRQWRTGKAGVLQSMGSQRVRHNWAAEQQQQHPTWFEVTEYVPLIVLDSPHLCWFGSSSDQSRVWIMIVWAPFLGNNVLRRDKRVVFLLHLRCNFLGYFNISFSDLR